MSILLRNVGYFHLFLTSAVLGLGGQLNTPAVSTPDLNTIPVNLFVCYFILFVHSISKCLSTDYGNIRYKNVKHCMPIFIIESDVLMEIYFLVIVLDFIKLLSASSNKSRSKRCIHKMNRIYVALPRDFSAFKYFRDNSWQPALCMWPVAGHVVPTVETVDV